MQHSGIGFKGQFSQISKVRIFKFFLCFVVSSQANSFGLHEPGV